MSHEELMQNVPLLAADALTQDESRLVRIHLSQCDECQMAFEEYQKVLGIMANPEYQIDETGKEDMRAKFQNRLSEDSHSVKRPEKLEAHGSTIHWKPILAWAASILIALGGWASALHYRQTAQQTKNVLHLMASGHPVSLTSSTGQYRAVLYLKDNRAVVWASGLPHLTASNVYEGWWIENGHPVRAGTFDRLPTEMTIPASSPDAFAITIEPAGGTSAPTTPVLVIGSVHT